MKSMIHSLAIVVALAGTAMAQFSETEDNNNKAQANVIGPISAGATITGSTTGSSTTVAGGASADYFRISTGALPTGLIYEHTLTLTTTTASVHTLTIRGLNQSAGVPTAGSDATFQTAQTVGTSRVVKWYGFGRSEQLYVRVTGSTLTTGPYTLTMATATVSPIVAASSLTGGCVTISTVGQTTTDTDLWVYDNSVTAIPGYGNDDEFLGPTLQSRLTRSYAPGTYNIAISRFECGNNLGSPADDDYRSGLVADFPDVHVFGSSATGLNCNMLLTDTNGGSVPVAVTTPAVNGVGWVQFTVAAGPAPWETNSAASSLDFDGVQGNACTPAVLTKCAGQMTTLNIGSTNVGLPFEVGLTTAANLAFGSGALITPNNQMVNLDVTHPSLVLMNGNWVTYFGQYPPFPGNFSIAFPANLPTLSAQMVNVDPSNLDGAALSQAATLNSVPTPPTVAGPSGDDNALIVTANTGPNCLPSLSFFGTTYNTYAVQTNGRMTFGASNTSFTPVNPTAAGTPAWAGIWADYFPAAGQVVINNTGGGVRIDYINTPMSGDPATSTFSVEFLANGDVLLSNIALGSPLGFTGFLGVSPGGTAAIAGGVPAAPWAAGSGAFVGAATDAVGVIGTFGPATLVNGLASVLFTYNGAGYSINL